ncbi:MAG TPA: RNA-guided endonuclease TnpB family protein [Candidatus Obscuribacterales bacterium]
MVTVVYKAIRTKLDLNNQQKTLMAKHAGFARWVYNWALRLWKDGYKQGLKPNAATLKKLFTNHVKPKFPWMKEVSSKVYQYTFMNLKNAFGRFFKKLAEYPRFKKKYHSDSFSLDNSGAPIKIGGLRHKLPFIGWVKTFEMLPESVTKKVTISRQAGDWYLSFFVELPDPKPTPKPNQTVGVDLGVANLATLSTGEAFSNPKALRKATKKLARLQRCMSRKVKGSSNYKKASLKVAKLHRRVANIRADYLHKLTTYLAKNHGTVVVEDLNVSGMLRNHKLARVIADCGFYEFRRQLEYKCQWYGSELVIVNRFYPSSQLCSDCGHQQKMPLKERVYTCSSCGISLDRDLNAAINLSKTVSLTGLACGVSAADGSC